jgi:hypothetical protein
VNRIRAELAESSRARLKDLGEEGAIPLEIGKFPTAQHICAANTLFHCYSEAVNFCDGIRSFFDGLKFFC